MRLQEEDELYYDRQQQCCDCCGVAFGVMQRGGSSRVPTTSVEGSMNEDYLKEVALVASENPEKPLAWGWPYQEYKQKLSLLVERRIAHGKKKSEFSYLNLKSRSISIDESKQLWTSGRYARNGQSTEMKPKSAHQLRRMNFGLKQKGGYYNYHTRTLIDPSNNIEENEYSHFISKPPPEENAMSLTPSCSAHKLKMNETALFHTYPKRGIGTKLNQWGCNPSLTVILTRFDDDGNVQAMATINELGEYEFATITSSFQNHHGSIIIDDERYTIAKGESVVPLSVTSPASEDMIDETGRLIGKGLAQAHAVIFEHFGHESCPISEWNFYAMAHGIVDDSANTMDAWVETSYVIHHMTEYDEKVALVSDSEAAGVWRSIDIMPFKNPPKSQHATSHNKSIISHSPGWKYDPFVEFEIWHADHSFVAAMACDFVKDHYHFDSKGSHGFGHSKPRTKRTIMRRRPDALQMIEEDLNSKLFT